jgi:hypothetical protein
MTLTPRILTFAFALVLDIGRAWGGAPIHVQLHDIIAPVALADGRHTTTTLTFFLGVAREADVDTLCRRLPVVRDALVVAIHREPLTAIGRHVDSTRAAPRLKRALNDALGAAIVAEVNVITGVPRERTRGVADWSDTAPRGDGRTTGSTTGCRRIAALPGEVEKQARAVLTAREAMPQASALATQPPARPSPAPGRRLSSDLPSGVGCARRVESLWRPAEHIVANVRYRLARVFTLDDDYDGRVENVGFLLRADGRPDLILFYFDAEDRPSAATVPSLQLSDEREIGRLCFGQVYYGISEPSPDAGRGKPQIESGKRGPPNFITLLLVTAAAAAILLGVGTFVGYLLIVRRRRADRRRQADRRLRERRQGPNAGYTGLERRAGGDRRSGQDRRHRPDRRDR